MNQYPYEMTVPQAEAWPTTPWNQFLDRFLLLILTYLFERVKERGRMRSFTLLMFATSRIRPD